MARRRRKQQDKEPRQDLAAELAATEAAKTEAPAEAPSFDPDRWYADVTVAVAMLGQIATDPAALYHPTTINRYYEAIQRLGAHVGIQPLPPAAASNGTAEAVEEGEDAMADEAPEVSDQQPEVVSVEAEVAAA